MWKLRITKYEGTTKELADFFFGTLKKKVEDAPKVDDKAKVEECKIFPLDNSLNAFIYNAPNSQEDKVTVLLNKVMGELKNFNDNEICEFSFKLHTGIANLHNDRN